MREPAQLSFTKTNRKEHLAEVNLDLGMVSMKNQEYSPAGKDSKQLQDVLTVIGTQKAERIIPRQTQ